MNRIEYSLGQSHTNECLVEYRCIEASLVYINNQYRHFIAGDLIYDPGGEVYPHTYAESVRDIYIGFIDYLVCNSGHMQ